MTTANATQETDSQADHQSQQDGENSQGDHSSQTEGSGEQSSNFDARGAFNKTNERLNSMGEKLEKFDPDMIEQIAQRLGITKKEAEEKVEETSEETPDVESVVQNELWKERNADRVAKANEDGAYDKYLEQGLNPDHALRLAEQDAGIVVDTSKQTRQQQVSAADSSVDRSGGSVEAPDNHEAYGLSKEDVEKYGDKAKEVVIHR